MQENPYAPPESEPTLDPDPAIETARRMLADGAGPGSIRYRLVQSGVAPETARDIVRRLIQKRKRADQIGFVLTIIIFFAMWAFGQLFFRILTGFYSALF